MVEREKVGDRASKLSGDSSYEDTNSVMRTPLSGPYLILITAQRDPSLNKITLGVRASTYEFGSLRWVGGTIHSIAPMIDYS